MRLRNTIDYETGAEGGDKIFRESVHVEIAQVHSPKSISGMQRKNIKRQRDQDELEEELKKAFGGEPKFKSKNILFEQLRENYKDQREGQGGHMSLKDKVEHLSKVKASLKELRHEIEVNEKGYKQ